MQRSKRQWLKLRITLIIFGLLLLGSVGTIWADNINPDPQAAGSTTYYQQTLGKSNPGSATVGSDGSASYSYSMGPVSLCYNSNRGWYVGGYSVITRSGRKGVPRYTVNDLFELDGEELVYTGGSNPREYRTKRESWRRIRYYRPETSSSYWIVENPDGSKAYYGNEGARNSRIFAKGGKHEGSIRAWAIDNELSRGSYNWKQYYYTINPSEGSFYLSRVVITKRESSTPSLNCILTYTDHRYPKLDCRSGSFVLNNKILSEVKVFRGSSLEQNNNAYHLNTYVIESDYDVAGEWQVKSITPWGAGMTEALNATFFEYYDLQPKFRDADPSTSVIDPVGWTISNDPYDLRMFTLCDFIDLNGDGLVDRVSNLEDIGCMMNNGSGFDYANKWPAFKFEYTYTVPNSQDGLTSITTDNSIDMNQDGLPDRVVEGSSEFRVFLNNKNGTFTHSFDLSISENMSLKRIITDSTGNTTCENDLIDMNNDGLPDIIKKDGTVYFNTGTTFNLTAEPCFSGISKLRQTIPSATTNDLIDMNGDGLPDFVEATTSSKFIIYNTGYSTSPEVPWINHTLNNYIRQSFGGDCYCDYMDINGDGRPDLIHYDGGYVWVQLNMGYNQFSDPIKFGVIIDRKYLRSNGTFWGSNNNYYSCTYSDFIDMNGDGLLDRVFKHNGSNANQLLIWFNESGPSGKLKTIINPLGGTTEYSYKPIDKTVNPDCKPAMWAVDTITEKDGMGQALSTAYEYKSGVYDFKEREFLGFGEIKVTQPTGDYTLSLYHTEDHYLAGKPINVKNYNRVNILMDETIHEWGQMETATGVKWTYLKKTENRRYDGDPSISFNLVTEYQYDNYGNPTVVKETGDSSKAGVKDLRITQNWYNNDTTNWNLGQLRQTGLVGYDQNRKLTFQRSTYHNYDSKGNLVKTRSWLENTASPRPVNPDGTTNPANGNETNWVNPVEYFYDTYGNVNQVKDARGNSSYTTYDSKFGLFPIKQTNALGHIIWSFYDSIQEPNEAAISAAITRGWLVKTLQAQTGINTITTYDSFGRPIRKMERGFTDAFPNEEISYTDAVVNPDGTIQTPACVTVGKRHDPSAVTPNYLSYTYSDGMGRTIQTKAKHSDTSYSTIDTYYEINGKESLTKVSVPYATDTPAFSARDTAQLKTVTVKWLGYDGRYTAVIGTEGSVVTTKKSRGSTEVTDALGSIRRSDNNAIGLTEKISEDIMSATPPPPIENTYLTGSGELVKMVAGGIVTTMEYNSLGQKIKVVDPDLGTVTYTYDSNGNLIRQVDANLKTTLFQYDALNRITKVTYQGDNYDQFIYDEGSYATGKLSRSYAYRNGVKVEENQFTYNQYGDLYSHTHWIDGKSKEIQYVNYDGLGRITNSVYPNGDSVRYVYHPSGFGIDKIRVTGGGAGVNIVSGADYEISGRLEKLKLNEDEFNINYKYWEYDEVGAGLLKGIKTDGIANKFELGYIYDRNGNVTNINDWVIPGYSQSFVYDSLNQLVEADGGTLYKEKYDYEANGNMIKKAAKDLQYGINSSGTGSKPHAVKDDGTYVYRYDAAGNLSERLSPKELSEQIFDIPRSVFYYGIYGLDSVTLNDRVKVRNYHGGWAPVGCYGTVQLGSYTFAGSVTAHNGPINLRGGKIYGDAQTLGDITLQYGSEITGVSYANTSVSPRLTPEVKVLQNIDFTGVPRESKWINSGSSLSLAPGKYWDYTINSGATLKLTSGVYYFNSLVTNSGSTINLDESGGAIKIYVQSQLQLRAKLSHTKNEPYGATYLFIGYLGNQDVYLGGNDGGTFAGTIVAPKAKIIGGQENTRTFQGMYIAKRVEFHQDSQIYSIPFYGLASVDQYCYDDRNRLIEIKQNFSTRMTSVYGVSGERIKKVEKFTSTDSYYFFPEYEEEYLSTGAAKARTCYYFAFGKRVAKKDANGIYYYFINDHLGSTSQIGNDGGGAVKTLRYLPYGETVLESGTDLEDYKFNGKELDESGLYYYGARFYNPVNGRFTTADSETPGDGFDLLGLNRYAYCLNNPIKYVDPSGHAPAARDHTNVEIRVNQYQPKEYFLGNSTGYNPKLQELLEKWGAEIDNLEQCRNNELSIGVPFVRNIITGELMEKKMRFESRFNMQYNSVSSLNESVDFFAGIALEGLMLMSPFGKMKSRLSSNRIAYSLGGFGINEWAIRTTQRLSNNYRKVFVIDPMEYNGSGKVAINYMKVMRKVVGRNNVSYVIGGIDCIKKADNCVAFAIAPNYRLWTLQIPSITGKRSAGIVISDMELPFLEGSFKSGILPNHPNPVKYESAFYENYRDINFYYFRNP